MVETGGLENRCTRKGTGGSNPSPSAIQSGVQRKQALFRGKSLENAAILRFLPRNRTGERVLLNSAGKFCGLFLRRHMGSPVSTNPLGEYNTITNR